MTYVAKNFEYLLGIEGLSNQLLQNHFLLYQGYVNNTNKLLRELEMLSKEDMYKTPEYSEMKRRFGWEFNAMKLHEHYFSNMVKGGTFLDPPSSLFKKIVRDFGSYDNWAKDLKSTALIRGIGWAALYFDLFDDRLFNIWIDGHNTGYLSTGLPILIIDMFEHSYIVDYGTDKKKYVDSFFKIIDWEVVSTTSDVLLI